VETRNLALDLGRADAAETVVDHCRQHGMTVEVLVNSAGFGDAGRVASRPLSIYRDMIALNLESLVELTSLFMGPMTAARRGYILNVASTAAFQPVPNFAVYAATKAFILSFTEALHEELKGTGVSATALCPGLTDTEFHARANTRTSGLMRLPMMSSEKVAKVGVDGLFRGKAVVVPGLLNRLMLQGLRLTPRFVARSMALRMMSPR
jgi:hypothetical protein